MGVILSAFGLVPREPPHEVDSITFVNGTSVAADVWINGGGPVARELPAGATVRLKMPDHLVKRGDKLYPVRWSATASKYGVHIQSGTCEGQEPVAFGEALGTSKMSWRALMRIIDAQRAWRVRAKEILRVRKHHAARAIQRIIRGRLARVKITCVICLDEMPAIIMKRTAQSCRLRQHRVCSECATAYVKHEVSEGRLHIRCPGGACKHLLSFDDLRKCVKSTELAHYRDLLASRHASRLDEVFADAELLAFAREHCRVCPACGVLIYRYEGCNSMRCRCGHTFNWADQAVRLAHHELESEQA